MFDSNIMTMENRNKITEIEKDGFVLVRQTDGPDLGYSRGSGVRISLTISDHTPTQTGIYMSLATVSDITGG